MACKGVPPWFEVYLLRSVRANCFELFILQGRDFQPDPVAFKRFMMLGLVDEKPNGFALTELGRQRLEAEQRPQR